MADISVVGAGYVGLVTGACWAHLGHQVTCVDIDEDKVRRLQAGEVPIHEPELEPMVRASVSAGNLRFTTDAAHSVPQSDYVFVAVQTPSGSNGEADLAALLSAARHIASLARADSVIVQKSTAPVGTVEFVEQLVAGTNGNSNGKTPKVVSNPEFLREGSAVRDFLKPDRVVVGSHSRRAAAKVAELYAYADCPVLMTDPNTAEMIKYASNAFLAAKISFINEIAQICDAYGADVRRVAEGMGHDTRIGHDFLRPGLGWGGSCFPKDVKALVHMAKAVSVNPRLLEAAQKVNSDQRRVAVTKLETLLGDLDGAMIGLLGLSFKAGTDDVRSAPAFGLAEALQERGATVRAYDPVSIERARAIAPKIVYCDSPEQLAEGADALVLVTEWPEFRELDMVSIKGLMRNTVLLDGRNFWDAEAVEEMGYVYEAFGVRNGNWRGQSTPFSAIATLEKTA